MFGSFDISGSALSAQRVRLDTIASNIANITSTRGTDGKPGAYRRQFAVFEAQQTENGGAGVRVAKIQEDPSDFKLKYEPGHPDANAQGFVAYPNVDLSVEYVNALEATRAYEANVTAIETTKSMINSSLRIMA